MFKKKSVGVLGAGAGGVAAALELAKKGYLVYLFEKNDDILLGSSNATPGRAGQGYHYIHPSTGTLYLNSTLETLKAYPECTRGSGLPDSHYMRHGLYMIMKEKHELPEENQNFASLFPKEKILETYEHLKSVYSKKVEEDSENKLFGEPDHFYIVRDPENYADIINVNNVAAVVDTREELLDWPKVRARLCQEVAIQDKIKLYKSTHVTHAGYDSERMGFVIHAQDEKKFHVDCIVNSTWENIEKINADMRFYRLKENPRTLRLKVIVTVVLPDSLKEKSSMFFCMGPHCMFSNMGNGTGMLTYAPVTNMESSTDLYLNSRMKLFLSGEATPKQKNELARKVIDGVSCYIPKMKEAKISAVGFGIIRTDGGVDVYDPGSDFHKRDSLRIAEEQNLWISNPCMKLLHFPINGKVVSDLVDQHFDISKTIFETASKISITAGFQKDRDIAHMLAIHLQRNFDRNAFEKIDEVKSQTTAVMRNKKSLNIKFATSHKLDDFNENHAWDKITQTVDKKDFLVLLITGASLILPKKTFPLLFLALYCYMRFNIYASQKRLRSQSCIFQGDTATTSDLNMKNNFQV